MRRVGPRPRCRWQLLVLPGAVLAVHELRYLLAYGSHAGSELSAHGDRYVATAAVITIALVALALTIGLLRLVAVARGASKPYTADAPLWLLWLGLTLALVAGFWALEALEAAFEPHHVGGVLGAFGNGGWWALPAAAFVAAVMAVLARGGRALLAIVARGHLTRRRGVTARWHPPSLAAALVRPPMASCAAGRAPPARQPV